MQAKRRMPRLPAQAHIDKAELSRGLKMGRYFAGKLRVNARECLPPMPPEYVYNVLPIPAMPPTSEKPLDCAPCGMGRLGMPDLCYFVSVPMICICRGQP